MASNTQKSWTQSTKTIPLFLYNFHLALIKRKEILTRKGVKEQKTKLFIER